MISGAKIRYYRKTKKITQESLAELSDLSSTYICQIESGRRDIGRRATEKIAKALNIPIAKLLAEDYSEPEIHSPKIADAVADCNPQEINIIYDMIISLKRSLRSNSLEPY